MAATFLMAAALLVVPGAPRDAETSGLEHVDVAYAELAKRQPNAAIERIRANDEIAADDPAALINLGSAYAMLGDKAAAEKHYRAALASTERYELQLADGSWADSRRAARMALAALARGNTLATR